ncbi:putative bifunctional diguanylate cyclase/phosphodiesterase [Catenuloplanes atrovinosus]|uniref:Diguanylate cyclase (GGDEF)-like protein n=1 Tax=Catenuloplanes atrovinosus TaxID=137266 RepID=A0AAE4CCK1_9ACTN|nr:bifunctional diguanylate cyclase/phosphodiesterase [Catenuloplanes atrovinosus]MDR7278054.1 diguanylate cyclase (GGDEF)-like protein [Catenuloplanes atrovinosus]
MTIAERAAPSRTRPSLWLWFVLGGAAVTALGVAVPVLRPFAFLAMELAAVGAVAVGIRRYRPRRMVPWWCILAGLTVPLVANVVWIVLEAAGLRSPYPGPVDTFYVLMYPLLFLGMLGLPERAGRDSWRAGTLETGIFACAGAVLYWTVLVDPVLTARDTQLTPAASFALAYPLMDLLIICGAVRLAVIGSRRAAWSALVVLAGLALAAGDTTFFIHVVDGGDGRLSLLNASLCWLVGAVLVGAAALHPAMAVARRPAGERRTHPRWMFATYLALVLIVPAATTVSLLTAVRSGVADTPDVVVPMAATVVTLVLLVTRLTQIASLAESRARALDRRGAALERALARQESLQDELSHQALHDPLTGLPNRLLLRQRVEAALTGPVPATLIMLDLDGFKDINDRFGHPTGDALIAVIAERLQGGLRAGDTLARLGGDEFAVLLEDVCGLDAVTIGEKLVRSVRLPVEVGDHRLHTTASVGLRTLDSRLSTSEMLRDVDLALYAAKAAGKDRVVSFDERLRADQLHRTRTVDGLRAAIDRADFAVHYQPLVDLRDEQTVSVEALVRWTPSDGPPIPPDQFISVAEDSGLIVPLGAWVLRRACLDAVAWHHRYGVRLSVNVSVRQLREPDFEQVVREALEASGLPAHALTLEITESVLVADGGGQAITHLTALRRIGVKVAVDDFGTGYSSLAYLQHLPIDSIKIDKAFVPVEGPEGAQQVSLIRAIIDLARSLALGTVVEGVETADQARLLHNLGCQLGQGYHFSRPITADAVERLLAADRALAY